VPDLLLERLRIASEQAISRGTLRISDARLLMDHLESSLRQSTYLKN
jgi:arginine decarboxylase